ncbi:lactosylceramide 1,3-N-acetyl-beta-D-glucosaminyltransferase isoform X2 [Equus caballus]|uniref:lactosylceramide 1,3-N-acetyl-beta-D-glucosaminyltransferase isoform X2 n=1 Tax=Equus caballus TaxID=9796 RepID=UPI0038B350D5
MVCSLCRGPETGSLGVQGGLRATEPLPRPARSLPGRTAPPRGAAPPGRSSSRAPGKETRGLFCSLLVQVQIPGCTRTFTHSGRRSAQETPLQPSQHPVCGPPRNFWVR